jgi:hypothetical protein
VNGFLDRRRPVWLVLGVGLLALAVGTALLLSAEAGAEIAAVLALPAAVIVGLAPSVWRWFHVRDDVGWAAGELAGWVANERGAALRQALGSPGAAPADVEFTTLAELTYWRAEGAPDEGNLANVSGFVRGLSPTRLVVLGEPGSGKTVLGTKLVLDLLRDVPAGDIVADARRPPVPVWLSLPSCDLGDRESLDSMTPEQLSARLDAWIIDQLAAAGVRPGVASHLVRDRGWLLPVLDGLDEMDSSEDAPVRAEAVLRALNARATLRPVVLLSRRIEYLNLGQAGADQTLILQTSEHIVLRPLSADRIVQYLEAWFGGSAGVLQPRWEPVRADLNSDCSRLVETLSRPLYLSLAVTAYAGADTDPRELLDLAPAEARGTLLAGFAAASARQIVVGHGGGHHNPDDVTRWLATLAHHLERVSTAYGWSETDLLLPDLWMVADTVAPRRRAAAAAVVLVALPTIPAVLIWSAIGSWSGGLASAILLLLFTVHNAFSLPPRSTLRRLDLAQLTTRRGRPNLAVALAAGLGYGLLFGPVFALAFGLAVGLAGGLAVGLAFALAIALAGGLKTLSRPSQVAQQSMLYALAVGLAVGLAFGLAIGLAGGLAVGLAVGLLAGLLAGLLVGLVVGQGQVWLRYAAGVHLAHRQGILPRRPAAFLDWAYMAGLLRLSGPFIQFRHRDFQDWVTTVPHPRRGGSGGG